jgi:hypothetical protein
MPDTVAMTRSGARRWAPPAATALAVAAVVAFPLSLWLYFDNRSRVSGVNYLYGDYTAGLL